MRLLVLAVALVISFVLWVGFISLCVKVARAWGWL